jgi:hypothetical protein
VGGASRARARASLTLRAGLENADKQIAPAPPAAAAAPR